MPVLRPARETTGRQPAARSGQRLTLESTPRSSVGAMTSTDLGASIGVGPGENAGTRIGGPLTVAQLARASDVRGDTIRYYEREGLLPKPPRSAGNYRQYDPAMVERLRFIAGCRRLGLALADIRELLATRDTGVCPCDSAAEHLARQRDRIDAEIARLSALRARIDTMVEAIPGGDCPPPEPGSWCPPSDTTTEGGAP